MKKIFKIVVLSICTLLIPYSVGHAQENGGGFTPLDGLVYYLYVKGPARIWTPTFEFKAGNTLKVVGASYEYGELNGVWQEAPLGFFSFFWAQVESEEPVDTTTTTTTPNEIPSLSLSEIKPAQTEKTKFLINLWGLSFPENPFVPIRLIIGSGDYMKATGVTYIGLAAGVTEPAFGSIGPNSGAKESSLTDVQISCFNTTFLDGFSITIQFQPSEGLTVSNQRALSNTLLEFDLEISSTAATGPRSVTVTYGDPPTSVVGNSVFTVTE